MKSLCNIYINDVYYSDRYGKTYCTVYESFNARGSNSHLAFFNYLSLNYLETIYKYFQLFVEGFGYVNYLGLIKYRVNSFEVMSLINSRDRSYVI